MAWIALLATNGDAGEGAMQPNASPATAVISGFRMDFSRQNRKLIRRSLNVPTAASAHLHGYSPV
jgi:hypothetical protein